jgi:hypothetical protein
VAEEKRLMILPILNGLGNRETGSLFFDKDTMLDMREKDSVK